MPKQLTEVEEQLLHRLETGFGRMSSKEALDAALKCAWRQMALERYAELREKEEALCRLLVMEPGDVPHFTQPERVDHA